MFIVFGAALAAGATLLLISMINRDSPSVKTPFKIDASPVQLSGSKVTAYSRTRVTLTVSFSSIDRGNGQVGATVAMYLPNELARRLRDETDDRRVFWDPFPSRDAAHEHDLELRIESRFSSDPWISQFVPLSRWGPAALAGDALSWHFTFQIPGTQESFPDDWYWFSRRFSIQTSGMYLPVKAYGFKRHNFQVPADIRLGAAQGLAGVDLFVSRTVIGLEGGTEGPEVDYLVNAVFRTENSVKWFAYLVVGAPLAILLASLVLLIRAGEDRKGYQSVAAVALAIVSIVPIREVTVPNDVIGLTRIDAVLGAEVGWAVAVLLVMAGWSTVRRPSTTARNSTSESG